MHRGILDPVAAGHVRVIEILRVTEEVLELGQAQQLPRIALEFRCVDLSGDFQRGGVLTAPQQRLREPRPVEHRCILA